MRFIRLQKRRLYGHSTSTGHPNRDHYANMAKDKRSKGAHGSSGSSTTTSSNKGNNTNNQPPISTPPAWPVFKPKLPVVDLQLEPYPGVEDKVVVFRSFWPRSLCKDYVAFLRELPLVTTPGKPKRGEAVRVNDRFQIDDPKFAHRLWTETGLKEALLKEEYLHMW